MKFCTRLLISYLILMTFYFALLFLNLMLYTGYNKTPENIVQEKVSQIKRTDLSHLIFQNTSYFNRSALPQRKTHGQKVILLYNVPAFLIEKVRHDNICKYCEYQNCLFTRNTNRLLDADAIIFYVGIKNERMGQFPPIKPEIRNPNQVWIFTATEPPEHYYNTDYLHPSWYNTMNLSSLYRTDSDVPIPYGAIIEEPRNIQADYESIYNMKTNNAVWFVSHCQVASERRLFVNEMIKHGFQIDIFGGCGPDGRRTKTNNTEFELTIPKYKFYIAFENSICIDYISEKFFRNYNYDWIIIARGGADYNRLMPTGSFINTADFQDVKSLVDFLLVLGNNKDMYIDMLKKKDIYTSFTKPFNRNCHICRKLNNLSKFRKTYSRMGDYLNDGQCKRANDL